MTERCAVCGRHLYTASTWPVAQYATGLFGWFGPHESAVMHTAWGWRSEWHPDLCRECDTAHDHRKPPGVWHRIKRWWRGP